MAACVHMDDAQWCEYHRKPDFLERDGAMWHEAFRESTSLLAEVPQVTATIVPVPTTTRVELRPSKHGDWSGHGRTIPRNEHPSLTVLTKRPDDTERLLARLVAGRPDWVPSR